MNDGSTTAAAVVLVACDGTEAVVCHLDGRTADLAIVDALARLQLAARREGWEVVVRGAPAELRGLLELTGLAGVLALEPRRQPELLEQLGVEEVVQPRDRFA